MWRGIQTLSLLLVLAQFTQIVFGYQPEIDFWTQRKVQVTRGTTSPIIKTQDPQNLLKTFKTLLLPSFHPSHFPSEIRQFVHLKKSFIQKNGPLVYLLQDIHLNEEAQKNMAEAIKLLAGISPLLIGVEGSVGPFDFTRYQSLEKQTIVKDIADQFLKEGRVGAVSYTGLTLSHHLQNLKVTGLEDAQLYMANVQAYRDAMEQKPLLTQKIAEKGRNLDLLMQKELSPALQSLVTLKQTYHAGAISFGSYLEELTQFNPNVSLPTPLRSFLTAFLIENSLDFKKAELQKEHILKLLAERMSPGELDRFLTRIKNINSTHFYKELTQLLNLKKVPLHHVLEFQQYLSYLSLSDSINMNILFSELKKAEEAVLNSLHPTAKERDIINQFDYLSLIRKLVDFELTVDEWHEYKRLTIDELQLMVPNRQSSMGHLQSFEEFYRLAEARNQTLVFHMGRSEVSMIVAGGFHTKGLQDLLHQKGFSYVVLTPRITKTNTAKGSAYLRAFLREKSPIEKIFSDRKLFLALPEGIGPVLPQPERVNHREGALQQFWFLYDLKTKSPVFARIKKVVLQTLVVIEEGFHILKAKWLQLKIADEETEYETFHELAHIVSENISQRIYETSEPAKRRYFEEETLDNQTDIDSQTPHFLSIRCIPFARSKLYPNGSLWPIYEQYPTSDLLSNTPSHLREHLMARSIDEIFAYLNGGIHSENPSRQLATIFNNFFVTLAMTHRASLPIQYFIPEIGIPAMLRVSEQLLAMSDDEIRILLKEIQAEEFKIRLEFDLPHQQIRILPNPPFERVSAPTTNGGKWPILHRFYDWIGPGWIGQALAPTILETSFVFAGALAYLQDIPMAMSPPVFALLWICLTSWLMLHGKKSFSRDPLLIYVSSMANLVLLNYCSLTGPIFVFSLLFSFYGPHFLINSAKELERYLHVSGIKSKIFSGFRSGLKILFKVSAKDPAFGKRLRHVLRTTFLTILLFVVLNEAVGAASSGTTILNWYANLIQRPGWTATIAAALAAVLSGTIARMTSLYLSGTEAKESFRKDFLFIFISLLIWRPLLGITQDKINWLIDASISHEFAISRSLVSLVAGITLSSIYEMFEAPVKLRSMARKAEKAGDMEKAKSFRELASFKSQMKKTILGIFGRLVFSYTQHNLTQNWMPMAFRVPFNYALGYVNQLFRSTISYLKDPKIPSRMAFRIGVVITLFNFWLVSKQTGVVSLAINLIATLYFLRLELRSEATHKGSKDKMPRMVDRILFVAKVIAVVVIILVSVHYFLLWINPRWNIVELYLTHIASHWYGAPLIAVFTGVVGRKISLFISNSKAKQSLFTDILFFALFLALWRPFLGIANHFVFIGLENLIPLGSPGFGLILKALLATAFGILMGTFYELFEPPLKKRFAAKELERTGFPDLAQDLRVHAQFLPHIKRVFIGVLARFSLTFFLGDIINNFIPLAIRVTGAFLLGLSDQIFRATTSYLKDPKISPQVAFDMGITFSFLSYSFVSTATGIAGLVITLITTCFFSMVNRKSPLDGHVALKSRTSPKTLAWFWEILILDNLSVVEPSYLFHRMSKNEIRKHIIVFFAPLESFFLVLISGFVSAVIGFISFTPECFQAIKNIEEFENIALLISINISFGLGVLWGLLHMFGSYLPQKGIYIRVSGWKALPKIWTGIFIAGPTLAILSFVIFGGFYLIDFFISMEGIKVVLNISWLIFTLINVYFKARLWKNFHQLSNLNRLRIDLEDGPFTIAWFWEPLVRFLFQSKEKRFEQLRQAAPPTEKLGVSELGEHAYIQNSLTATRGDQGMPGFVSLDNLFARRRAVCQAVKRGA